MEYGCVLELQLFLNFLFYQSNQSFKFTRVFLFKNSIQQFVNINNIKIGEKLTPSVFVGIRFRESSIINDDLLRSIKISIKKLKVYCKLKYGLKLKTNIIDTNSDFHNYEDFLSSNITKHTKDDKEPLNKLSVIDNTLKFNASETQSFNMTGLLISLTNDEKREITPLDFANFYNLRNFKVNKDGDLYVDINIEKIASILYNEPNIILHLKCSSKDLDEYQDNKYSLTKSRNSICLLIVLCSCVIQR